MRKRISPAIDRNRTANAAVTNMLRPDETLIRVAHISGAIYWKGIVVFVFAGLLMLNPVIFNLGVFMMIVALIILANAYLTRYYLLLVLTDKRVMVRRGILTLDTVQLRLNRIESVELEWTPPGRVLGYSIVFITGTGSRVTTVPFVADGQQFRKELDDMLFAMEERGMAPTASAADIA